MITIQWKGNKIDGTGTLYTTDELLVIKSTGEISFLNPLTLISMHLLKKGFSLKITLQNESIFCL